MQRFSNHEPLTPEALTPRHESGVLLFHAGKLPLGVSPEENTQPFRGRSWLFAHQGALEGFERLRAPLLEALPEFLRRQVRGVTDSEVVFAHFLKRLRETGRTEDPRLEAEVAGALLAGTAQELDRAAAKAGAVHTSQLNLVAANGHLLLATRWGEAPLYYTRLEGTEHCEVCGLEPSTPDTQPGGVAHRRRRAVVVASHVKRTAGWVELPQGTALAVSGDLQVRHLPAP
ncbi:conserved hypothetical protein [Stigmatella aurantiaca DW4/3-1]|nr:conserved hypothetical protein [Stigmatella aurantiaca DW4/3-1]